MNNEIKEILDKAKEISDYGKDGKQHTRMFNQFEAKALLDYITNLQEENKELNLELSGYRKAILNDDNLLGLKSRIDKAIEYIENVKTLNEEDRHTTMKWEYGVLFPKLEKILQGSDKDE